MSLNVCIITREFPPDTAFGGIAGVAHMEAHALSRLHVGVHIISLAPTGVASRDRDDDIIVYREAAPRTQLPPDMAYVDQGLWSQVVAARYRELDELIGFDVLETYDYYGEGLHVETRPETLRVVRTVTPSAITQAQWTDDRPPTAGERAAAALELVALGRADVALASSPLILDEARRLTASHLPVARVLPFPLAADRFADGPRAPRGDVLRAVFVGRLEPRKGVDLALRAVAHARRRGMNVELTVIGRDVEGPSGSYRRGVLVPLMSELDLEFGDVRFVSGLDDDGVRGRLRSSDVAIVPSRFESWHLVTCEAIAQGVPVISTDRIGVASLLGEAEGLKAIAAEDDDRFAEEAADALADTEWLASAARTGRERIAELLDPEALATRRLALYDEFLPAARSRAPVTPTEKPAAVTPDDPRLGIVMLTHNALSFTRRAVGSVLRHTDVPFHLILVDNASTDGTAQWATGIADERVSVVLCEQNLGVPAGRNVGLQRFERSSVEHIVFLDNDVEVYRGWCHPFLAALAADPNVAITGESGVNVRFDAAGRHIEPLVGPGPQRADMVIGYCMFVRRAHARLIGRFDENIGLFWHDDDEYCLRAGRLGYQCVHVASGRIVHFEHRSSSAVEGLWDGQEKPSSLSDLNLTYLAERERRATLGQRLLEGARWFSVLAFLDELLVSPELLRAWCSAFRAKDDATLVIYGPDASASAIDELHALLAREQLDGDDAADLMLVPVALSHDAEILLAQDVCAVLSHRVPSVPYAATPRFTDVDVELIRELARRHLAHRPAALAA